MSFTPEEFKLIEQAVHSLYSGYVGRGHPEPIEQIQALIKKLNTIKELHGI